MLSLVTKTISLILVSQKTELKFSTLGFCLSKRYYPNGRPKTLGEGGCWHIQITVCLMLMGSVNWWKVCWIWVNPDSKTFWVKFYDLIIKSQLNWFQINFYYSFCASVWQYFMIFLDICLVTVWLSHHWNLH